MLFSNKAISTFIRNNFEAAWESVRPVPVVDIDFGDGVTLKRTINGNTATYICMLDGRVLDIIPGINSPETYLADLRHALTLYQTGTDPVAYHRILKVKPKVRVIIKARTGPVVHDNDNSKYARIEFPILAALEPMPSPVMYAPATGSPERASLEKDTAYNRRERKPIVHEILSERSWKPAEITKRVYREVLNCDLDDPYLGLATIAFNGGGYGR